MANEEQQSDSDSVGMSPEYMVIEGRVDRCRRTVGASISFSSSPARLPFPYVSFPENRGLRRSGPLSVHKVALCPRAPRLKQVMCAAERADVGGL